MAKNQMAGLIILSFFCLLQISLQKKTLTNPKSNSTSTSAEEFVWSQVKKHGIEKMKSAMHSGVFSPYYETLNRRQKDLVSRWMLKVEENLKPLMLSNIVIIPSEEFVKENPEHKGFFNVYLTPEKKFAKKLWINVKAIHSYKDPKGRDASPFAVICALPGIESKTVKYLLESGIQIEGRDKDKALVMAANSWNYPLVKFLVENGGNVNAVVEVPKGAMDELSLDKYIGIFSKRKHPLHEYSKIPVTPLGAAVFEIDFDVINYLLGQGADVNTPNKTWTMPLPPTIDYFHPLLMISLMYFFNVNNTDMLGQTALHKTVAKGNVLMSELLLRYKADVTATDHFGWTPLHFAALYARNDSKQLIKQLLDQGSDINAKTDGGFSPLNLLEAGSDLTFLDYLLTHLPLNSTSERKSVRLSEKESRIDIVRLFLERGADPNHQDDILGWSTLHWAAAVGDALVWKLLVEEYGCNSAAKSKLGWTPPDTAKYFNL